MRKKRNGKEKKEYKRRSRNKRIRPWQDENAKDWRKNTKGFHVQPPDRFFSFNVWRVFLFGLYLLFVSCGLGLSLIVFVVSRLIFYDVIRDMSQRYL